MKRAFYLGIFLLVCVLTASAQTKELFILHSSDTHSRIEPVSPQAADPNAGMGGAVRRATLVKQYREQHPDMLLRDTVLQRVPRRSGNQDDEPDAL